MRNKFKDEDIKKVMNSLQSDIPAELDIRINNKIREGIISTGSFFNRLDHLLKWSPVFASVILLMIFGLLQLKKDVTIKRPLKEIKIVYEIKDKNIKILWVKKEGFLLNRRKK